MPTGILRRVALACVPQQRRAGLDRVAAAAGITADTGTGTGQQAIDDPFRVGGGIVGIGVRHAVVAL